MKQVLNDRLVEAFPLLYKDGFQFECGDGWFALIFDLSDKVTRQILKMQARPCVSQVKEKWGQLSFYMTWGTPEIFEMIEEAEMKSGMICEKCGEEGVFIVNGGWVACRCDKCKSGEDFEVGV